MFCNQILSCNCWSSNGVVILINILKYFCVFPFINISGSFYFFIIFSFKSFLLLLLPWGVQEGEIQDLMRSRELMPSFPSSTTGSFSILCPLPGGCQDIHHLFHFISRILRVDGKPQRGFCSLVVIITPILMISNLSWIAAFLRGLCLRNSNFFTPPSSSTPPDKVKINTFYSSKA